MKRKIILSSALILSLTALLLTGSDSRVAAQNQIKVIADTGMITLGQNQILRVIMKDGSNSVTLENFVVRRIEYSPGACNGGICKHTVASQNVSDPIPLRAGEAVSIDFRRCVFPICGGVRGVILSDSRDVQVNAMIIDTVTGEVVAFTTDLVIDVSG
jgi:hypothetical protein